MEGPRALVGIAVVLLAIAVYFLPCIIAARRDHPQGAGIFLLCLFLGWTVLGWIGALVWSVWQFAPAPTAPGGPDISPSDTMKSCPDCAEQLKAAALVCRYCGHRFGASPSAP